MDQKGSRSEFDRQVIVLILSLLVSIIAGFIPEWTGQAFTIAEQTLLSVGLFSAFLLIDVMWVSSELTKHNRAEHRLWMMRNGGELLLSNIRAHYFQIVQDALSQNDLFILYFLEEFEQLAHRIKDASESQNLRVTSNHLFVSKGLFDPATYGGDKVTIRYLWLLDPKERLFEDYPWRRFFEQLTVKTRQGIIKSTKTLFVVNSLSDCEAPRIRMFLDFFKTTKGFDCRLILEKDYHTLCEQNSISLNYVDFGVYGSSLLFRTEHYEPETTGVFSKDASLIRNYVTFFEIMWNSQGLTKPNPSTATRAVSLSDLYAFDLDQPETNTNTES